MMADTSWVQPLQETTSQPEPVLSGLTILGATALSRQQSYQSYTIQDLVDLNLPEPEWLIEGLLPVGYTAVLSGPPKSGKGYLTIDMLCSVAEGSPFLGRSVKQGPVIYASAEEPLGEVKKRFIERISGALDVPVHVLPVDGTNDQYLKLGDADDVDKLIRLVESTGAILVVLDVLRRLHDAKENESDGMNPIMNSVMRIARSTGAAVIVNHHMNKNGTTRGSNAIDGGVDVVMALTPLGRADKTLPSTLEANGRSVPPISLQIKFDEAARWLAVASSEVGHPHPATNADLILGALELSESDLAPAAIAKATGAPLTSVQTTLSKIKKTQPGRLIETSLGGKGSPLAYRLNPHWPQE